MTLNWETLRSLARMADDIGVLSVYVTLDPHGRAEATGRAPFDLRMRHQLEQVREHAKQHLSREDHQALLQRLDALSMEFERLRDPAAPGQGRALFAGVASGEVRTITLQVPLGDRVVLEPDAFVRPLINAWNTSGPAGAVAISAEEIRVVDTRLGDNEEIAVLVYDEHPEQRDRKGPAGNNPAYPQHFVNQRDLYDQREEDKLLRYLRSIGENLAGHGEERGWEHLVLTGETHLVQAVVDGLPPTWANRVVTLPHTVANLTRPKLVATVAPELDTARQRHRRDLATRAHDLAMAAGAGAIGLGETLDALQQGRVDHLLLVDDQRWTGSRTPDGRLVPNGEVPPGVPADQLQAEPHMGERMIELALDTSARVTILDAADAGPLADHENVGALLRW